MDNKLKIWREERPFEENKAVWERKSEALAETNPLKGLKTLPQMPGITKETARGLKYKSIFYLLSHDENKVFLRYFFKHPLRYALRWIRSALKKKSYLREKDFYFYGLKSTDDFIKELQRENSLLVVGFSYCHKPFECPSKRFTPDCIHDPEHPVCRQCFIGKTVHALPAHKRKIVPLFIPTIHYIGEKIFEIVASHPDHHVLFLITACEMTLEMFGDWGNMVGVQGIGVRLDGRICNTHKAFHLSEQGIKPGLTVVLPETQEEIFSLLKDLWEKL